MTVGKQTTTDVYLTIEEVEWLLRVIKIANPETEDRQVETYLRSVVKEYDQ